MRTSVVRCPRSSARTLVVSKTLRPPVTQVSAPRPPFANVFELSRNPPVTPLGCHNHPRSHAFIVKIQRYLNVLCNYRCAGRPLAVALVLYPNLFGSLKKVPLSAKHLTPHL